MPPPTTEEGREWLSEAFEQFAAGAGSEGRDRIEGLARGCKALENLLADEPSYASDIQQLALSSASLFKAVEPEVSLRIGDVGVRAGVLVPDPTSVEVTRAALLDLCLSEASLVARRYVEAEAHLDTFDIRLEGLDSRGAISAYMEALADCLRGRLYEEGLERDKAAAAYLAAADRVGPLLSRSAQRMKVVEAWVAAVLGPRDPDELEAAAEIVVRQTLAAVSMSALLGRLSVDRGELGAPELKKVLDRTWKEIDRYGLPERQSTRQLAALVGLTATRFGAEKAHERLDSLPDDVLLGAHLDPDSDRPILQAAIAHALAAEGDDLVSGVLYSAALRAASESGSKATTAAVLGRYVADTIRRPDQENDLLESFLTYLTVWGFREPSPAEKADVEASLATLVDYALALWEANPSPFRRLRLGLFLDLLKRPQWVPLPSEWSMDASRDEPSSLTGLWMAMDWLGRLQVALRRDPRTAVIVIQSTQDRTVYLCLTPEDDEILSSVAWRDEQAATNELAPAAREELDFLLLGGGTAGDRFTNLCRTAFEELPDVVRRVIAEHETLLLVPDARTDGESAPLELFHDGDGHLGITRVVTRTPSLRDAVRVLEGGQPSLHRQRALVAAAPVVPGADPLLHAAAEAEHVRLTLEERGWDAPPMEEVRLNPQFLVDRLHHVSVAHLAAHGISTAGDEALLLPGGLRLTTELLARRTSARMPFVYLNTCFLGTSRYLGGGTRRGIAHAFLELGSPAVVSSLAPVDDRMAAALSAAFYDEAQEHPVGEALRRARATLAEQGVAAPMWATTILFGNPHLRLFELKAKPKGKRLLSERLLDAAANYSFDHSELEPLVQEAMLALEKEADDSRLRSALLLVDSIGSAEVADDAGRTTELHFAVELADQLGHAPSSALLRLREADDHSASLRNREALQALESALPILDSLYEVDSGWREIRLQGYGLWKRLDAAERGEGEMVLETDDTEEEAAVRLNEILGSQAVNERAGDDVVFRTPERSLDDIAWNAVLVGHPQRFKALRARTEVAAQLAAKLERAGFLPKAPLPARTVLTGMLDYLWRGLAPLDAEIMHKSAGMLRSAVEDVEAHWISSTDDTWLDAVVDFEDEIRSSVSASRVLRPHDVGPSLRRSRKSLWGRWQELAATLAEEHPLALAGCCAFVTGAIVEAQAEVPEDGPARNEILGHLRALLVLVEGGIEHAGLLAGYDPSTVEGDELERWRREEGLTRDFATPIRWAG